MSQPRDVLRAAFAQCVPEIADGSVEIVTVAREPGKWAKVSVRTNVCGLNPVGVCIGVRGVRVADVEKRLGGERINIVRFHPEPTRYVLNALKIDRATAAVTDARSRRIRVIVTTADYPRALGKAGNNVRLARQLTGWTIQICTTECAEDHHHHPGAHAPLGLPGLCAATGSCRARLPVPPHQPPPS
jgi:transcription termination/antitermination protein NusA